MKIEINSPRNGISQARDSKKRFLGPKSCTRTLPTALPGRGKN